MTAFARTAQVLTTALTGQVFTAVSAEVGGLSRAHWTHAGGRLSADDTSPVATSATVFDLASLTKVLATATLGLRLVARRQLNLDAPVGKIIDTWAGRDRETVTIRDLFEHSSGLPAYRLFYKTLSGRRAYELAIAAEPLEYVPRTRAVYSDLGFILLGFVLEKIGGTSLDAQFVEWQAAAGLREPLAFTPPLEWRSRIASTGLDPWRGRVLHGEVHDENTAALGGVAAHAGLFGTAASVGEIARWWLTRLAGQPDPLAEIDAAHAAMFVRRSQVPGSSRALAWDTMLPTSSCGTRLSKMAFGHTGFTGTSLWIDPANDLYAVLLTNHVYGGRDAETIRKLRRAFHDAVAEDLNIA